MATLPGGVLDFSYELFVGNTWVDITTDVHAAGEVVRITSARANESSDPETFKADLVFDNATDKYSTDNPTGPYFGDFGLNTPLRVSRNLARDTFSTTVVNEWNTDDLGHDYQLFGTGGSILFSDWQKAGGKGTMSIPVANGFRRTKLPDVALRDVDVAATFSLPFTDVTGGNLDAGLSLREAVAVSSRQYYVRIEITPAEAVLAVIYDTVDGTLASATVPGLTHTSSQALRIRAQVEEQTIRGKVWPAGGSEPYDWHVVLHDYRLTAAGAVGVRCGASSGNTNAKPILWSVDDLVIRTPRCAVELSSIKHRWGSSDTDRYAVIEASGILWRLGQGNSALQSTLRRGLTTLPVAPVAYWPAEDSEGSTSVASAIPGVGAMYVAGPTEFASYDAIDASMPLPVVKAAAWIGSIPPYTSTGFVQLRYVMHEPAGAVPDHEPIVDVHTAGSGGSNIKWEVKNRNAGDLALEVWTTSGVNLFDSGVLTAGIADKNVMISLELTQNGANVDWRLAYLEIGLELGFFFSGTVTSQTLRSAVRVSVGPYYNIGDTTIGHINVRKEITSLFDLAPELVGYTGESSVTRITRLCVQNNISLSTVQNTDIDSARMGPQRPLKLLELLKQAADADQGTLTEPRGELGISYRERAANYNQAATVTLDYAAEHLSPPFVPVVDDLPVHNDVTVSRVKGSSAREEITEGRLSVLEPKDGGVGRYDHEVTVNVYGDDQLADLAGWIAHMGTIPQTRYPKATADLGFLSAALAAAMCDLHPDDRFDIVNARSGQTPNTISQLARGFAEELTPFTHQITLNGAPESAYRVLEFDNADSHFDGAAALAIGINTVVNSFTVTVPTTEALWTTDPADMPIEFTVDGEVISVGAVSGTSSPQTFSSVTRSVNSVVKSHLAGAALELTDRATSGL